MRTTRVRKFLQTAVVSGLLVALGIPATATASSAQFDQVRRILNPVRDQYIVVLKPSSIAVGLRAESLARESGGQVRYTYRHAMQGFSIRTTALGAQMIAAHPFVELVEEDASVSVNATQSPAALGLDRIDQRFLPLDNSYGYGATGSGVTAYIIDTGIRTSHADFGGRATSGFDAIDGGAADDCHGHGTHVAGTLGGATYGVAKQVSLVAVRVLDCGGRGLLSQVIAGVDWVTGNHQPGQPAVANMSLTSGASTAVDKAVKGSIAKGVSYVAAAGNNNANACNYSPARVPEALTVGATTSTDDRAGFSNFGKCLDLFAPGVGIISAWSSGDSATATLNGTSMAAPHVAGLAAKYLQSAPTASPAAVASAIEAAATRGLVQNAKKDSPNLLLYTGLGEAPPAPPPSPPPTPIPGNVAPVADFTYTCGAKLKCKFVDASTDADGKISKRNWEFGDGGKSTNKNPGRKYKQADTYKVTLTVTDNKGATGKVTKTVIVS